jgi:hypothetical protein
MSDNRKVDPGSASYGDLRLSVIKIGVFSLFVGFVLLLILLNAALTWWMMLILAGPIYLISEWAGKKVFAAKYGWSTEQVGFSLKRIAVGVLLVLGVSAIVIFVSRLFS